MCLIATMVLATPAPATRCPSRGGELQTPSIFVGDVQLARDAQELGLSPVVLSNGLTCLYLANNGEHRAGLSAYLKVGNDWIPTTSRHYGDWTYVGASVIALPTDVSVIVANDQIVGVRWLYGSHTIPSPCGIGAIPYPFAKTVWLLANDRGYYTDIEPLVDVSAWCDPSWISEHEVGFGGLWGDGLVVVDGTQVHISEQAGQWESALDSNATAATFDWRGDSLRRIFVPLVNGPMLVPYFSDLAYGGIFLHLRNARTYSAYFYFARRVDAEDTEVVCRRAWERRPTDGIGPLDRPRCS